MKRFPAIHHCTSQPYRFFGRDAELRLLDQAFASGEPSVVAFVGPGGQGKTAIVQHWLARMFGSEPDASARDRLKSLAHASGSDGVFLWSFYRGKDSDLCLREMLAYAEGLDAPPDVSASWCVDRLLRVLRTERWAVVLDGTEVVQHEQGGWFGRFVHPELGRLVEELASMAIPGVVVLTSRFPLPGLEHRLHARVIALDTLDADSAIGLLETLGVQGSRPTLAAAARACGFHAKAVELLGTFLTHFQGGHAEAYRDLPELSLEGASAEENHVARVLLALHAAMPGELKDILALATSFRQPPTEARLCEYLHSAPVRHLLHETRGRTYVPFAARSADWLRDQVQTLIDLRLLERVGGVIQTQPAPSASEGTAGSPNLRSGLVNEGGAIDPVLDAHPLVRRGFEDVLGSTHAARSRAGFLRGRPDRRPPRTLEEAREEVELFHAYADAGLWNDADSTYVALDNPKHRFLAPAFERDLLLRFFPGGDWGQAPLWAGFGRHRSLAICFEMLGQFEDAIEAYRPADAALRGDALIALGRLQPLLDQPQMPHPWQTLWQAYRAHALALVGRREEALALALSIVPTDIYEWVHVFECLLRLGRLDAIDLGSVLYRPPFAEEHRFAALARERMRLDYARLRELSTSPERKRGDLGPQGAAFRALLDAYDRGGLPFERVLARLSYGRWLTKSGDTEQARAMFDSASELCRRFGMVRLLIDCTDAEGGRP